LCAVLLFLASGGHASPNPTELCAVLLSPAVGGESALADSGGLFPESGCSTAAPGRFEAQ